MRGIFKTLRILRMGAEVKKNAIKKNIIVCCYGQKSLEKIGGVEVVVYELTRRMAKKGIDVTCINRSGDQSFGYKESPIKPSMVDGVKIRYAPTINLRGIAAMTSSVFATFMASFGRYNVIHIHAEGAAFLCWLPKLMRKKVVVTIHGLDHQRAKWGKLASWYIKTGEKNAVRFADEIIVLSKGVQKYFKDKYKRETIYIPNGVNKAVIRKANQIKKIWGLEKDDYLLYLGRIVPEKGVQYLIEAFKQVKTDKKLVIAGGSSDTENYLNELKEIARNDNRIIFSGFVYGEKYEELFSNAYLYCLPSDLEGMPLSLLEAMSYGNCCIVSSIAECTEVVEDKAVIFQKGNVEELKRTLEKLIYHEEIVDKYKREAVDFICNKYSWDDVTEKTLEVYY